MVRKKLTFLAVVLSLTIVFAIGVILGWSLSTAKATEATKILKENELNTESFLLEQELFETLGSKGCELTQTRLDDLSQQLYTLGIQLGTPTAKQDLGEENYHLLKRRYHLLQIKTYTLYYRFRQSCVMPNPVFLFYYSKNDAASAQQGEILDDIVAAYDARVFAIEFQYSPELAFLEQYYNITSTPTIIMNYGVQFTSLTQPTVLEQALEAKS